MGSENPRNGDSLVELPAGTHGLFDNGNPQKELGKLIERDDRETWVWRTDGTYQPFPSTFVLKIGVKPAKAARAAQIFEYDSADFTGTSTSRSIPSVDSNRVYKIERGGSLLGYLTTASSEIGGTLSWWVGAINASKRMDVATNDALVFTQLSCTPADYTCYTLSESRKAIMD